MSEPLRSPAALPLARYKVLDLTIARAGPVAVRLLSDWGADVTRIEAMADDNSVTGRRRGSDEQNAWSSAAMWWLRTSAPPSRRDWG